MQSKVKTPIAKAISSLEVSTEIVSLEDAGYKTASNLDGNYSIARFVMSQDSKFPNEITEETKRSLYVGFQRKNNENVGHKYYYYSRDDKTGQNVLIPIKTLDDAPKGTETINVTVDYAMSLSTYEYSQLRDINPALKSIVKERREAFSKYASECLKSLASCANKILNGDKPKERKPNDNFRQSLEKIFNGDGVKNGGLDKKVKLSVSNGDVTADEVMYRMAKEAFFKIYTKK
jgi:hypothetical protein